MKKHFLFYCAMIFIFGIGIAAILKIGSSLHAEGLSYQTADIYNEQALEGKAAQTDNVADLIGFRQAMNHFPSAHRLRRRYSQIRVPLRSRKGQQDLSPRRN